MPRRLAALAALCVLLAALSPGHLAAQTGWQFVKIADTGTTAPGSAGNFSSFSLEVAVRNGVVIFQGNVGTAPGVYSANVGSAPTLVANSSTTAPGTGSPGTFTAFESPSVDAASNVAFVGTTSAGRQGVYTRTGGSLGVVADTTTVTPNSPSTTFNTFTSRGGAAIDNGHVAFTAFSRDAAGSVFTEGAYTNATGALTAVADRSNLIPGSSTNFVFFSRPALGGPSVVFTGGNGSGGRNGVYAVPTTGGALTTVADQSTPLPGGGTFALEGSVFRGPTLDNGQVGVFSFNSPGFYKGTTGGGALSVIANGTTVPNGFSQPFNGFDILSMANGKSALLATNTGAYNLWSDFGGSGYSLVLALGQTLDGKTINEIRFGRWGFDGNEIAFRAAFTDGSSGVYVAFAPVPEPSAVLAVGLAGVAAWRLRRRRRRVGPVAEGELVRRGPRVRQPPV
jgi:hypothetical protein